MGLWEQESTASKSVRNRVFRTIIVAGKHTGTDLNMVKRIGLEWPLTQSPSARHLVNPSE